MSEKTGIRWVRYVLHQDVEKYIALGWRATGALRGCHHGERADIVEWLGEAKPPEPELED